ncbi:hypothetical protein CW745_06260 [Psychromonas sp. psych-6C06]|uniref:Spy/CpxP family protein refolding chaperone n=1 Tax=Psychromonas sp. psych-6C06 TaxID=2058089 RepID=UPI000C32667F|nr:Spy/CpxP family protein refolding chaperone [Psychromonas sp. psych-6C06]PKF63025.1 hypothetical protein CW745_06260 [Psychromonas sp. psych-6C06]
MKCLFRQIIIVAVALPLSFSIAYAKEDRGNNHHKNYFKQVLKQIDLSTEQKSEIKVIMKSYRSEKKNKGDRGAYHHGKMAILKTEKFDTNQAQALIDRKQSQQRERKLTMLQMEHQIYQALTPSQQDEMDKLFEQHHQSKSRKNVQQKKAPKQSKLDKNNKDSE